MFDGPQPLSHLCSHLPHEILVSSISGSISLAGGKGNLFIQRKVQEASVGGDHACPSTHPWPPQLPPCIPQYSSHACPPPALSHPRPHPQPLLHCPFPTAIPSPVTTTFFHCHGLPCPCAPSYNPDTHPSPPSLPWRLLEIK